MRRPTDDIAPPRIRHEQDTMMKRDKTTRCYNETPTTRRGNEKHGRDAINEKPPRNANTRRKSETNRRDGGDVASPGLIRYERQEKKRRDMRMTPPPRPRHTSRPHPSTTPPPSDKPPRRADKNGTTPVSPLISPFVPSLVPLTARSATRHGITEPPTAHSTTRHTATPRTSPHPSPHRTAHIPQPRTATPPAPKRR